MLVIFRVVKIRLDNNENNEFNKIKAHSHLLQIFQTFFTSISINSEIHYADKIN